MSALAGWIVAAVVFGCVVTVVLWLSAVSGGAAARRLRLRLMALRDKESRGQAVSVIRPRYLRQLSAPERWLEELPGMAALARLAEQAGYGAPAYRVVLAGGGLAALAFLTVATVTTGWLLPLVAAALAGTPPFARLWLARAARIRRFEEQLPDALDLMARSLRAGNPLLDAIKFVAEEMQVPIGEEFERAWSHINYGVSLKASLLDLLERTPSVSLRAMATAILVQRETGGNLAEILDNIAQMLRARARFQRRLRTLSAEGRMSAIFLTVTPFALAGTLALTSPTYLPMLLNDEAGRQLIVAGTGLMGFGIWWITRIVRIRV